MSDFGMQQACDLRLQLMALWEAAVKRASETGYWKDADACERIVDAYHNQIRDALMAGRFSGDSKAVLKKWEELHVSELLVRKDILEEARLLAPLADPDAWWVVLDSNPDATDEEVRSAFAAKMKTCHPDRVLGLAPEIVKLADQMAKRTLKAMDEYKRTKGMR